jgi:DNA-binding FrmR family transcriptional regulator
LRSKHHHHDGTSRPHEHLSHCVTDAIHTGGDTSADKLKEASAAIARLVRS